MFNMLIRTEVGKSFLLVLFSLLGILPSYIPVKLEGGHKPRYELKHSNSFTTLLPKMTAFAEVSGLQPAIIHFAASTNANRNFDQAK